MKKLKKSNLEVLSKEIELQNDYGIGRAYNQLGLIHDQKGMYKEALEFTLKAQSKFEKLKQ